MILVTRNYKNLIVRHAWREDEHRRIVASDRLPFVDSGPYSSDSIATKRPTLVSRSSWHRGSSRSRRRRRRLPTIRISIPRCHRVVTDALYNAKGRPNVNGKRVNGRVLLSGVNAFELRRRRVAPSLVSYFSPPEREREREKPRQFTVGSTTVLYRYTHDCMFTNCLISSTNRYRAHFFSCPRAASCRPLRYVSAEEERSTPTFVHPNRRCRVLDKVRTNVPSKRILLEF